MAFYSAYQWNAYWSGQYQIARAVSEDVDGSIARSKRKDYSDEEEIIIAAAMAIQLIRSMTWHK